MLQIMSAERKGSIKINNQIWVPLSDVKKVINKLNPEDKSQRSALLVRLEQMAIKRGFPWIGFLKKLEDTTADVHNPYLRNVKNPTFTIRSNRILSTVDYLRALYHDSDLGLYDQGLYPEDHTPDSQAIVTAVDVALESIAGKRYSDLTPLQKLTLLNDLERHGLDFLSPSNFTQNLKAP